MTFERDPGNRGEWLRSIRPKHLMGDSRRLQSVDRPKTFSGTGLLTSLVRRLAARETTGNHGTRSCGAEGSWLLRRLLAGFELFCNLNAVTRWRHDEPISKGDGSCHHNHTGQLFP